MPSPAEPTVAHTLAPPLPAPAAFTVHTAHYTSPRVLYILVRMAPACPLQLAPSQIARSTTRAMHSTVDALQTLSLSAAAGPDIRVPGYLVPRPAHISQGDAQRESAKLPSGTTAPRGSSVPSRGLHWVHGSDARNLRMGIPGPLQQRREPSPAEVVALLRGSPPWLRRLLGGSFHAQRRYRSAFASPPCAGAHPFDFALRRQLSSTAVSAVWASVGGADAAVAAAAPAGLLRCVVDHAMDHVQISSAPELAHTRQIDSEFTVRLLGTAFPTSLFPPARLPSVFSPFCCAWGPSQHVDTGRTSAIDSRARVPPLPAPLVLAPPPRHPARASHAAHGATESPHAPGAHAQTESQARPREPHATLQPSATGI